MNDTENNIVLLMDVWKAGYWEFHVLIVEGKCVQRINIIIIIIRHLLADTNTLIPGPNTLLMLFITQELK